MNINNSFATIIAGIAVLVPNQLKDFTLTTKDSSQVAFYGVNLKTDTIYIQFKNGKGYIYPNQNIDAQKACMQAESIGSWVIQNLSRPKAPAKAADFEKVEYSIEVQPES